MTDQYRRCVGMMILNNENKILVGKRLDHPSGHSKCHKVELMTMKIQMKQCGRNAGRNWHK